jgi:hypothetical protein
MEAIPPGAWSFNRASFSMWASELSKAVQSPGVTSACKRISSLGARFDLLLLVPMQEDEFDPGFREPFQSQEYVDRMKMPPPPPTHPKPRATGSKKKAPVEKEEPPVLNDPPVRIGISFFRP